MAVIISMCKDLPKAGELSAIERSRMIRLFMLGKEVECQILDERNTAGGGKPDA